MYVILIHLKHFKMSDREEEEEEKEEEEDVPVVIYTVKSRPIVYIYRHHPMHAFSNYATYYYSIYMEIITVSSILHSIHTYYALWLFSMKYLCTILFIIRMIHATFTSFYDDLHLWLWFCKDILHI